MGTPVVNREVMELQKYPPLYRRVRRSELDVIKANRLLLSGRLSDAESICEAVVNQWAKNVGCHVILSKVHVARGEYMKARQEVRDAIDADPSNIATRHLLATLLVQQSSELFVAGDVEAAYEGYRNLILMDMHETKLPTETLTTVYFNMGRLLHSIGMRDEALQNYEAALQLDVYHFRAAAAIADVHVEDQEGSGDQAIEAIKSALRVRSPERAPTIWAMLVQLQLRRCDWSSHYRDVPMMHKMLHEYSAEGTHSEMQPTLPLLLLVPATLALDCAAANARALQASYHSTGPSASSFLIPELPESLLEVVVGATRNDSKPLLNVAYVSGMGFGDDTPALRMLASLMDHRDRSQATITCVSLKEATKCASFERSCDNYLTVGPEWDRQAAADLLFKISPHVLVHLSGLEDDRGVAALSFRTAAVQMTWQGYAGSLGSDFVHHMVTDHVASPPDLSHLYTESLLYLPVSSFLHNLRPLDSGADQAGQDRGAMGLLGDRAVLGCLSSASRLDPGVYSAWMEVLRACPHTLLWVFHGGSDTVRTNLHLHAQAYGVGLDRVVVSDTDVPTGRTLGLVDLYLDTRGLNAEAADVAEVLAAGDAVVSLAGDALGRRVSASLLHEYRMSGLFLARDMDDYERLAVRLAARTRRLHGPRWWEAMPRLSRRPQGPSIPLQEQGDRWPLGLPPPVVEHGNADLQVIYSSPIAAARDGASMGVVAQAAVVVDAAARMRWWERGVRLAWELVADDGGLDSDSIACHFSSRCPRYHLVVNHH